MANANLMPQATRNPFDPTQPPLPRAQSNVGPLMSANVPMMNSTSSAPLPPPPAAETSGVDPNDPNAVDDETERMRLAANAAASNNPFGNQGAIPGEDPNAGAAYGATAITPTDVNSAEYRRFEDQAYADATRRLDPQYAEQERAFQQQMVNQGLQPGTEAYDAAYANFTRSKNDAYDQARRSSLAEALAAQNQAFTQGATQAQINAQLAAARIAANAQRGAASISSNAAVRAAQMNNQAEMERLMQSLGFNREQLAGQMELGRGNLDVSRGNLGVSQGQLGLAGQQADFGNLMGLLGMYNQNTQYNNSLLNSDYSRGAGLLGLIPGLNPGNVDVTGAYGLQNQGYQNQLAAYGQQQNSSNATMGTIGTLGAAAIMVF